MPGEETPADTLDAIGLLCPEPLFQARTAIDALEPGEVLEVLRRRPRRRGGPDAVREARGSRDGRGRGQGRLQALPDPPRRVAALDACRAS